MFFRSHILAQLLTSLVFSNCVQHPPWTSLLPGLKADIWGLGPLSLGNTKRICSQGFSGPVPGERQVPAENIYWASLADSRWNWSSWVLQGSSELFLILCHIYYVLASPCVRLPHTEFYVLSSHHPNEAATTILYIRSSVITQPSRRSAPQPSGSTVPCQPRRLALFSGQYPGKRLSTF